MVKHLEINKNFEMKLARIYFPLVLIIVSVLLMAAGAFSHSSTAIAKLVCFRLHFVFLSSS
jgi:hypothetical protein